MPSEGVFFAGDIVESLNTLVSEPESLRKLLADAAAEASHLAQEKYSNVKIDPESDIANDFRQLKTLAAQFQQQPPGTLEDALPLLTILNRLLEAMPPEIGAPLQEIISSDEEMRHLLAWEKWFKNDEYFEGLLKH